MIFSSEARNFLDCLRDCPDELFKQPAAILLIGLTDRAPACNSDGRQTVRARERERERE